jgi:hypothetical protein
MFRWDAGQRIARGQRLWAAVALVAWAGVGVVSYSSGQSTTVVSAVEYQNITEAQINSITYDDLPDDNSFITPFVNSPEDVSPAIRQWMADFGVRLSQWAPGKDADPLRRTTNMLCVAAVADLDEFQYEGEVPVVVFQQLRAQIPLEQLRPILAYIILHPPTDGLLTSAADLGIPGQPAQSDVRDRAVIYAKKFLGRLLGKIS